MHFSAGALSYLFCVLHKRAHYFLSIISEISVFASPSNKCNRTSLINFTINSCRKLGGECVLSMYQLASFLFCIIILCVHKFRNSFLYARAAMIRDGNIHWDLACAINYLV